MRFALIAVLALGFASRLTAAPPNVVLIVADDLGVAEVGCYGQKLIRTPSVDRMAAGGMRFTRFYTGNAVCAPSRCVLMTGKHAGHATVRNNRQFKKGQEGQYPLRADDVTVAELLKAKGYATAAMGKWGLGMFDTPGNPLKHGFDSFFGYNCQAHAHSHYPTYLYRNDQRFDLPGNNGTTGDTYSQDLFEAEALKFLESNKAKPFFLYLPFIVPHVAVQVPADSLAEYKGKLGDDPAYDGTIKGRKSYLPHPAPHAGYAAMVTRMDRSVGRILDKLKELKLDANTLVIFTSDNGPTHNVGGADSTFFHSAGGLRGLKGSLYEGGIRNPFVAYWPGTIKPGTTCDTPFYFPDVLPTLCELAGAEPPKDTDGVSVLPTLLGKPGQKTHDFLYWEFPAYGGQQAVRAGDWKAVRQNLAMGGIKTELYNLAKDPNETTDVAARNPDVLKRLEAILREQHTPSEAFPLQTVDRRKR
ncbi:MAG TPA: arylsulfatase [Fimbriiglobus sp.]|nr:arylsulfatase [Fimbriiglobus sp.]